jgi:hypothetical protein
MIFEKRKNGKLSFIYFHFNGIFIYYYLKKINEP